MSEPGSITMEKMWANRQSLRNSLVRAFRAAGLSLVLALLVGASASAQQQQLAVTGLVTSTSGNLLSGVLVRVQGTDVRATTNANGRYAITAPPEGTLVFTLVGRHPITTSVGGRTTVNVSMAAIAYLEEVVVTAYTEQRRADITGAVASINVESANRQTGASVLQKLDAVPGITVVAGGSPGGRSTVRIRGVSSFQNNDPLYIVDGVPVQDSYVNWLNPADITSVQVLKDASAASIYGSRASNGVIVIETTRRGPGGPPRVTFTARTGMATPVRGYDDFLITDALQYFQIIKQAYVNAGQPVPTNIYGDPNNPTIPAYTYAAGSTVIATDAFGRPVTVDANKYSYPSALIMPASTGTNWWKSVFSSAPVSDYNLAVAGGTDQNAYGVSFNYFDQTGTAAYNRFRRGSLRINTSFTPNRFSFGENVAVAAQRSFGGIPNDDGGEGGILGKNILMQPVVPIYDVQGNFASGKAPGMGNNTNPLKSAFEARNNISSNNRVFGNVFGGFAFTPKLNARSSLGFNVGQNNFSGFNPITPENQEPTLVNSINENQNYSYDWTWSNTLKFSEQMNSHGFNFLVGQEATAGQSRSINAGLSNLLSTDVSARYVQDALGDSKTKTTSSTGGRSSLLSFFGKADYNFADKYVATFTLRKDGSSRLGPENRWGTFPAVGLGWRLTKEGFLANNSVLNDAMLRFGWGVTGNQSIPSGRTVSQFGGAIADTYYDITGSNSTVAPGYRQTSLGNPDLKWEENRSTNIGADLALFDNQINVVLDFYRRNTNNLLFNPALPGTAGVAAAPIVNIGKMKNTGVDFSIGHQAAAWNATLTGTKYKNEIVSIDGNLDFFIGPNLTRLRDNIINQVGQPIGSFYGYIAEGMYKDAAAVAAHAKQDGAAPGRIAFKDMNGDGTITAADRTIIGSPHPDYTLGLDLGFRRGNWDLSSTVFGSFGNDIFDAQKDFYVFRDFSTNVRADLLTDSWTPQNTDAKYPRLDQNDTYSKAYSSFYVEDGSYVRLRNVQLGYNIPASMARWLSATRVYVQGENLFTFTGYDGLDPSLPARNVGGAAGDIRDQYRGVDTGVYPSSRTISIGITTSF